MLAAPLCFPQVLFTTHSRPFGQAYGREQDLREAKLLWLYGAAFGCFCFLRERERGGIGFEPLPPLILLVALLVVGVAVVVRVGVVRVAGRFLGGQRDGRSAVGLAAAIRRHRHDGRVIILWPVDTYLESGGLQNALCFGKCGVGNERHAHLLLAGGHPDGHGRSRLDGAAGTRIDAGDCTGLHRIGILAFDGDLRQTSLLELRDDRILGLAY